MTEKPVLAVENLVMHYMTSAGPVRAVQTELDMSMIYISHDMAVIAEMSDMVGIMYAGRIVEMGETVAMFQNPIHPYTRALMSAFPSVTGEKHELTTLPGEPPNLLDLPSGCSFHPRCPYATDVCKTDAPPTVRRGAHWAECWNPLDTAAQVKGCS